MNERRTLPVDSAELRLVDRRDGKEGATLVGYAAVWDRLSVDLGGFRERIRPGAFAKAIQKDDVRCLRDHHQSRLLGRMSNGTLRLSEDEIGLRFECDLPDTTEGRDVAELVRRGDINGCSFSFTTEVDERDYSGDGPVIRTLIEIRELFDVGPVSFPAYPDTSVARRSIEADKAEAESVRLERYFEELDKVIRIAEVS